MGTKVTLIQSSWELGGGLVLHNQKLQMKFKIRSEGTRGFTLVELLVVITIIVVLAALVFALAPKVFEQVNRSKCSSNLRQQIAAMRVLAQDHNDDYYWPARTVGDDSAPSHLYPEYVSNLDLFICPSTKNQIRNVRHPLTGRNPDLGNNARDRWAARGGHSYEYFGFYSFNGPDGGRLIKGPRNHTVVNPATGQPVPPIWTVLALDGDDQGANNYPEPDNNHGSDGWNWGFADGHVEWVSRANTNAMRTRAGTGNVTVR